MKKVNLLSLVVLLVLMLSSCGKYPQAEIDSAKAVVDSAKMAQVDKYLPDQFGAIQDSLNSAIEKAEKEKSKMFKNFGDVTKKLQEVTEMAKKAISEVEAKKARISIEQLNKFFILENIRNSLMDSSE